MNKRIYKYTALFACFNTQKARVLIVFMQVRDV